MPVKRGVIPNMGDVSQATRVQLGRLGRRPGGAKRARRTSKRSRARSATSRTSTKAKRSGKRPARLVKGSAAAKRYMASIRRKRRR